MALTTDTIRAAAQTLAEQQQGKRPSMQQVRDALGGGSFSTIGAALKDWQPNTTQAANALPHSIEQTAAQAARIMAAQIWAAAQAATEALKATETKKAAEKIADLEQQNKELLETLDKINEVLQAANNRAQEAENELKSAKNENEKLKIKEAQQNGKIEGLEKVIKELKPAAARKTNKTKTEDQK